MPDGLPDRIVRDVRYHDRKVVLVDDVKCQLNADDIDSTFAPSSVKLRHVWFDYHKKCKADVATLKEIFSHVFPDKTIGSRDYFLMKDGKVRHIQQRIARTNCIDCLDRTNVVQTFISRVVLNRQLQDMGARLSDEPNIMALNDKVCLSQLFFFFLLNLPPPRTWRLSFEPCGLKTVMQSVFSTLEPCKIIL